jgi:putative nucleotidyltransferase with HDIG domain
MKQAAALTSFEAMLDSRDSGTYAHCQRTAKIALVLGRIMDLSHEQLLTLERGVFLHDIGKIHIPARILKKTDLLQESEWKIMRGHAISGYAMVSANPVLTDVAAIVLAHHERYDGTGYPHRLEAEEIPLGARICAIADCFDMLTATDHAYRRPCTVSEACRYIQTQRGTHFDPRIVEAFLSVSSSQWRQLHASNSQPQMRRLNWNSLQESTVDVPVAGVFDMASSKMIASCGAA